MYIIHKIFYDEWVSFSLILNSVFLSGHKGGTFHCYSYSYCYYGCCYDNCYKIYDVLLINRRKVIKLWWKETKNCRGINQECLEINMEIVISLLVLVYAKIPPLKKQMKLLMSIMLMNNAAHCSHYDDTSYSSEQW